MTPGSHGVVATKQGEELLIYITCQSPHLVARWLSLGVSGGYNWMLDFAEPIGRKDNYSGPQLGVNIGWLFGGPH